MDLYNQLEDKEIVFKVNERFYEKIYEHPWMSQFFTDISQEFITQQQTDFIIGAIGGPKNFSGRLPSNAHPHMLITNELFDLREAMLLEALEECNAPQELRDAWIRIDESFRKVIVKESVSDLEKRYASDKFFVIPNPDKKKAA